ncbi:hypothetical protein [Ligilactobacillus murinus]|uniref:hypothetical protein n=1 Tax=Ligilactobacillus murinus TaxID=1622 RepID=UPI001434FF4D|nr:hypothetical protein [Ligilactobacillus murinus]GFI63034.1 hypothetical protein IMSAG117_00443 [Lactobacillaceae bacterium]
MKNFNGNVRKLQSAFLIITLLGTLAIIFSESRPLISTLLIVVIITVAFVNMLYLQQLSNDKKQGKKSELQKGKK